MGEKVKEIRRCPFLSLKALKTKSSVLKSIFQEASELMQIWGDVIFLPSSSQELNCCLLKKFNVYIVQFNY